MNGLINETKTIKSNPIAKDKYADLSVSLYNDISFKNVLIIK